eukprot:EG_transcript_14608
MSAYRKCLLCKEVKDKESQFTIEQWKCDACVSSLKASGTNAVKAATPSPPTAPPQAPPPAAGGIPPSANLQTKPAAPAQPANNSGASPWTQPPTNNAAAAAPPPATAPPIWGTGAAPAAPPKPAAPSAPQAPPPDAPPTPARSEPTLPGTAVAPVAGFVPPKCSHCNQPILGPALDAMQGKWHPDCFLCCICNQAIKEVDFAIVDGKQAHEACRPKPICCKCNTPIGGMILTALNAKWHEGCFRCIKCDVQLAHQKFYIEEDDDGNEVPLCEGCTPKPEPCSNCGQPVDRGIVALDATWHPHCFTCGACKRPLDGPFFPKGKVPFCSKECYLAA